MGQSIENYVSQTAVVKLRRQAFFVWGTVVFLIAFWIFLIVAAPIAEANNLTAVSTSIYKICSYICHQIPARSFFVENYPFAICSRCFGIYCGLLCGFISYPLLRSIEEAESFPRFWLFLAMIPMAVDWSLGYFEIWENTHFSRFATGLILGTACGIFLAPALIEILRLLTVRRQVKRLSM
jgi:uncharacterized membrane protein